MSLRIRFHLLFLSLFTAALPGVVYAQPNIVLIMADDMGWGDIAMNGNPVGISTPNLEKIARTGARFGARRPRDPCAPVMATQQLRDIATRTLGATP